MAILLWIRKILSPTLLMCIIPVCLIPACSSTSKTFLSVKESNEAGSDKFRIAEQAEKFDQFLNNRLESKEELQLKAECKKSPHENLFCSSIVQRDMLEETGKNAPLNEKEQNRRSFSVRAKFSKTKLLNWREIRFASVPSLLRGLTTINVKEIEYIKKQTLKETHCPNNMTIALGAFLEDRLPDRISLQEISSLYEKGARCPQAGKNDQEILLTRAGLFQFTNKNYDKAEKLLKEAAASPSSFNARSLYWLYRTQIALSKKALSETTLKELTQNYPFSFHAIVALTAAQKDPGEVLSKTDFNHQTRSERNSPVNSLLEQVEVLHRYHYEQSAAKVLGWAISQAQGNVEPEVLVYMSDLFGRHGDYQEGISILSNVLYTNPNLVSRATMERYFPRPYFPIFVSNSQGIDPYLLISIARRESAFNTRAVSSANAQGLLQLLPKTLRNMKIHKDLMDPESNVMAGSRYLSDLLLRVNGQVHLALAAYNAGPSKIAQWTSRYPIEEPVLFIDLIPYRETREYVAAVLRNYYWYRRIHENIADLDPLDYKLIQSN